MENKKGNVNRKSRPGSNDKSKEMAAGTGRPEPDIKADYKGLKGQKDIRNRHLSVNRGSSGNGLVTHN